jgi:SAM-dependent methyltransferase
MERASPVLEDTRHAFDRVAADYERSNAANPTLCHMREQTLAAIKAHVASGSHILDLGCGTGSDDEALARAGYEVTAIDWSPAMTRVTRQRIAGARLGDRIDVLQLGIHEIDLLAPAVFDAACSNFGPLNCVPSLSETARLLGDRLRPGGVLVASVIGRICPAEMALYACRGNWSRLRIRFSRNFVPVPLDGGTVWMRYYTPAEFERPFLAAGFTRVWLRGLGVFTPPPYAQSFAERHPSLVRWLQHLDDRLGAYPGLRAMGDHFLIVLRKR